MGKRKEHEVMIEHAAQSLGTTKGGKVFRILLPIALAVAFMPSFAFIFSGDVYAEEVVPSAKLSVSSETVLSGVTFTVDVQLSGASDFASAQGQLAWSNNLTLTGITQGSALAGTDLSFDKTVANGTFSFFGNTATLADNAVVATYEFTATADGAATIGAATGEMAMVWCGKKSGESIVETSITAPADIAISVSEPSYVRYGDANGDGEVDSADVSTIRFYLVGKLDASALELAAADVTGDGNVDSADVSTIRFYLVGRIDNFPVEG